jgi:hypothetical protein
MSDLQPTTIRGRPRRRMGRYALAGAFVAAVGLLTSAGVYASLNAVATSSEGVTAGTLLLKLSADTGTGFSNFTAPMAPGDIDNVFVNLSNTGTLASAAGMTVGVVGTPANALTDGSVVGEGLSVALTQCSAAWAAGVCSGTTTALLVPTLASSLATAVPMTNVPSLAGTTGQLAHVEVSLTLTATETSLNGVLPSSTVQGLSTMLTFTFTEQQRAGITTNQ